MTVKSRKEAEDLLRSKAHTDAGFRRKLVADPMKAITTELGIELPAGLRVTVLEETARDVYLVLPPGALAADELPDAALDAVAGGVTQATGKAGPSADPRRAQSGDLVDQSGQLAKQKLPGTSL